MPGQGPAHGDVIAGPHGLRAHVVDADARIGQRAQQFEVKALDRLQAVVHGARRGVQAGVLRVQQVAVPDQTRVPDRVQRPRNARGAGAAGIRGSIRIYRGALPGRAQHARVLGVHPAREAALGVQGRLRSGAGPGAGIDAQLRAQGVIIAHQPLRYDFVLAHHAMRDNLNRRATPARCAKLTGAAMGHRAVNQMRGVKALLVVAAPDDIVGAQRAVGKAAQGLERVLRDRLGALRIAG